MATNKPDKLRAQYLASNFTLRQFFYWREESIDPDRPLSQNVFLYELPAPCVPWLGYAWAHFVRSADAATARFRTHDGAPVFSFGHQPEPVTEVELSSHGEPGEEIFRWADPWWTSFREQETLVRHALFHAPDGRHYWLLTASHLVMDGLSFDLMRSQMSATMLKLARGETPGEVSLPSFRENMEAERAAELLDDRWQIHDQDDSSTAIDLPPLSVHGIQTPNSKICRVAAKAELGSHQVDALYALAERPDFFYRSVDATVSNMFTALTALWIWKHGGGREIRFGIPFHGRNAAERGLIGFKSETLPLCVTIDPETTFPQLVAQIHTRTRETLRRRGMSVPNPAHRPVIHAHSNFMFRRDMRGGDEALLRRVEFPRHSNAREQVHFLQFNNTDDPGGLLVVMGLHSATNTCTDESRLSVGYLAAVESLLADPGQRLLDICFEDPQHEERLARLAAPGKPAPACHWFETWTAARSSIADKPVLRHGDDVMTHAELRLAAGRWVTRLRDLGIRAGDRVLVCTPSNNQLAAAWLALASIGATYVPAHHATPSSQIRELAADLNVRLVLIGAAFPDHADAGRLCVSLSVDTIAGCEPVELEAPDLNAVAHVFHTSGSTGRPKAIAVTHRALATFTSSWIGANGWQSGEQIFHLYAITFDPWLSCLLSALALGGGCTIGEQSRPPSKSALRRVLGKERITSLCTPTAYFHALHDLELPRPVQRWIVGGEALASDRAMRFTTRNPAVRLVNAYGPTESTIWASIVEIKSAHAGRIPIGRPMPSCGFRVMDEWGYPRPFGVPGELWISGPQLAEGYVNQPDLTAQQFVEQDGQRWYRTGDLVRWRLDGDLDFLGRMDRQVQVRGHRVEPGEIEMALRTLPDVADALVAPVQLETTTALGAWVIPAANAANVDETRLRSDLLRHLPEYKVPKWIRFVEAFPRSANGKIDPSLLPPLEASAEAESDRLPSLTLWDLRLAFEEVLGPIRVQLDSNFFDLGGDSLLLLELLAAIERRFGKSLEATDVIQHPSIGGLAPLLETDRTSKADLVVTLKSGGNAPLFCIPGAGGIGVEFYPLSRRLPEQQTVIVLRSSGTDGHAHPPHTIDALLDEHVRHIQVWRQTHGESRPVLLMGYSLGGIFAWEVAQRLHACGVAVGQVFLIDAHVATAEGRALFRKPELSMRERVRALVKGSPEYLERQQLAAALDASIASGRILDAASLGRYNLLVQASFLEDINSARADFATTYFLAENGPRREHAGLWKQIAPNFRLIVLPGDHAGDDSIVREPNVAQLAAELSALLPCSADG